MFKCAQKTVKILLPIYLLHLTIAASCKQTPVAKKAALQKSWFSSVKSLFGSLPHEVVANKKYPICPSGTFTITNIDGDIDVKTHSHNYVLLTTKKRAKKVEHLDVLQIKEKVLGDSLSLCSVISDANQKSKIVVDYEVVLPKEVALTLTTNTGTIAVDGQHGPVVAHIGNGSFKGGNIAGFLTVSIDGKGDIEVQHTHETARLNTTIGNVKVHNAHKDVLANVHNKGKINVCWAKVPRTGSLQLSTQCGDVQIAFPEKAALTVSGKTKRGTVTCEHPLTLKSITTTLDKRAWALFKQEVEGWTGKGEAKISAASMKGNIKLTKNMRK